MVPGHSPTNSEEPRTSAYRHHCQPSKAPERRTAKAYPRRRSPRNYRAIKVRWRPTDSENRPRNPESTPGARPTITGHWKALDGEVEGHRETDSAYRPTTTKATIAPRSTQAAAASSLCQILGKAIETDSPSQKHATERETAPAERADPRRTPPTAKKAKRGIQLTHSMTFEKGACNSN